MCSCVAACFGFLFTIIRWLFESLCKGIAFLYSYDTILTAHAIITYVGFFVTFVLSRYWNTLMGSHVDSIKPSPLGCQCHCSVAPAPATIDHSSFFLHIWHKYHGAIIETLYYLAIAVIGFAEKCLVENWGSDRLTRIREALAHQCGTLGQLRKSMIEISVLRLIVFIGDVLCDPAEVDLFIFLAFVFSYLHFASIFKLIGIGNDFGWLDGLVSVLLAAFEHFVRPWSFMQLIGILLTTIVVCYKNTMWSGQGQRLQRRRSEEEGTSLIEMTRRESRIA